MRISKRTVKIILSVSGVIAAICSVVAVISAKRKKKYYLKNEPWGI